MGPLVHNKFFIFIHLLGGWEGYVVHNTFYSKLKDNTPDYIKILRRIINESKKEEKSEESDSDGI